MGLKINKIQDDGSKFIIRGGSGLYDELNDIFDHIALGVSVTESERGDANILYTENNRDIILRMLYDHTDNRPLEELDSESSEA